MCPRTVDLAPGSIGHALERRRLEHRVQRIEFVIAALRRLSSARATDGPSPAPLRQAIAGFSQELTSVRDRLDEMEASGSCEDPVGGHVAPT